MINQDISDFVAKNATSLSEINTGGGIDYFGKQLGDGESVIVAAADDAGSPETLHDEADLIIWLDDDWMEWIRIPFKTASEAYIAAHNLERDSA